MIPFLLVLFLLVCFALVVCVLLQAGKGGGLAAGFGGSGTGFEFLGGRQTASFLHQGTKWLGGAFLTLAFLISLLTARTNRPSPLIEREFQGEPAPIEEQSEGQPQDLESMIQEGGGAPGEGSTQAAPAAGTTENEPVSGAGRPAGEAEPSGGGAESRPAAGAGEPAPQGQR